jgi:hypothetical protein
MGMAGRASLRWRGIRRFETRTSAAAGDVLDNRPSFGVRVCACVRPKLADTDPAHSCPLPADPAASATTASAGSAASATSDDSNTSAASTGSCCAASAGSCSAAASATSGNFFDESGCSPTFLVEDIKRRQGDVRNFLLIEKAIRCLVTVRSLSARLLMRRPPSPKTSRRPPISVGLLPSDAFALKLASRAPW